ncbi:MAG: hypothetical protein AB1938_19895 [Myxococcota bacterium]
MAEAPPCETCGPLGESASRLWKDSDPSWAHGYDSTPPDVRSRLVHVAGDEFSGDRGLGLFRCRACGAWFEWKRSYEFLVGGSEDEETWTRVSAEHVAKKWGRT